MYQEQKTADYVKRTRRLTAVNMRNVAYWLDIAADWEARGDMEEARICRQRADDCRARANKWQARADAAAA